MLGATNPEALHTPEQTTTTAEFDRLTSVDSIYREWLALVSFLNSNDLSAIAKSEKEISEVLDIRRSTESYDKVELEWLESALDGLRGLGAQWYRVNDRKKAMELRPHEMWLNRADTGKAEPLMSAVGNSPRLEGVQWLEQAPKFDRDQDVSVVIESDERYPIEVPVANLVYMEQPDVSEEVGDGAAVVEVAEASTAQQSEAIDGPAPSPLAGEVVGYIQPNQAIIYAVFDGSDCVPNALADSAKTISTSRLRLLKSDENLVEL